MNLHKYFAHKHALLYQLYQKAAADEENEPGDEAVNHELSIFT